MRNVFTRYFLGIVTLMLVTSGVMADLPIQTLSIELSNSVPLDFDPDNYNFLVYDCGAKDNSGQYNDIVAAMIELFDYYPDVDYTYRNASTASITLNDLASHDILIVGWSNSGGTGGLSKTVIETGIMGRVVLSGHDADYHTATKAGSHDSGDFQPADMFFSQAIEYVLGGTGTGMVALGNTSGFTWLPDEWNIDSEVVSEGGETVSNITEFGYESGVYDGLYHTDMSNWSQSYHNSFDVDTLPAYFSPFELKYSTGTEVEYAITIAADVNPYELIELTKEDLIIDHNQNGTSCCDPNDEIEYTICWDNITNRTFEDVWIVDYLPYGVDYPEGFYQETEDPFNPIPPDPNYDEYAHSYIWEIGTIDPNNTEGCVSITVRVNDYAPAGMFLNNEAYIYSGDTLIGIAEVDTPVCCWQTEDADLIFVDKNAEGFNTGMSWTHAYNDLQDALKRASEANCSPTGYKIYVAEGSYNPGNSSSLSFILPYQTKMYGGFKSGGCDFADRNPDKYRTVLTGKIEDIRKNDYVVTMGDECVLDGFSVEHALKDLIFADGVDFNLKNCLIQKSVQNGINIKNGNVGIEWCKSYSNGHSGIYIEEGSEAVIQNSYTSNNNRHGIISLSSIVTINNSVITANGVDGDNYFGVRIIDPNEPPVLYNNTIAYNYNEGLSYVQTDPNALDPVINSNIIYYNNDDGVQLSGVEYPEHCCIYDPVNDPNGVDYIDYDGFGNFSGKPMFAYPGDPNNIHLAYNSGLKDRGDGYLSSVEIGSEDIDNETRIIDDWVDIGADEIYSCDNDLSEDDIYNARDWNADGVVNLHEFAMMSAAWLTNSPNTPAYVADPNSFDPNFADNWNETCNLYVDYKIDLSDFDLFLDEWLWTACWKDSYDSRFDNLVAPLGGETMMMVPMSMSLETTSSLSTVEEYSIDETTEKENMAMLVIGIYQIMDILDEAKYNADSDISIENIDEEKAKLEEILWEMYDDYYSIDDKKTKKDKSK